MLQDRPATLHWILAWPFVQAIRKLGFTLPDWARAAQTRYTGVTRVPHAQAVELLDRAVAFSGRADLGVLAAEQVEPGHFDLVELAARAQGTIEEGLTTLADLAPILHDAMVVRINRGREHSRVTIAFETLERVHPAGYDFVAASLMIGARRQTRARVPDPLCLRLPYPASAVPHPHPLTRVMNTKFEFDAPALEFEILTDALQVPLFRANLSLGQALHEAARELIDSESAQSPLVLRVRAQVRESLRDRLASTSAGSGAALIARKLHMSERTLRRKLDAEGVSLRELIDSERHALALDKLKDGRLSTDQIAVELGFTTAQAFHRAFRRWTGGTVQTYRARLRSSA